MDFRYEEVVVDDRLAEAILSEMKEMNTSIKAILEQIEDARSEALKRNCPEALKEQMSTIVKLMEGSPIAPIFKSMMNSRMGGV
jgi:hypothetical protein